MEFKIKVCEDDLCEIKERGNHAHFQDNVLMVEEGEKEVMFSYSEGEV